MRLEAKLQRDFLLAYGRHPGLRIWRANTGVAFAPNGRPVRFGIPGQFDLTGILIPSGRRLEIELKAPDGVVSSAQRVYGEMIRKSGGVAIIAFSMQDLVDQLTPFLA